MERIAKSILKFRYLLFAVTAAIVIASCFFFSSVNYSYDLSEYLPESSGTKQALEVMAEEFDELNTVVIVLEDAKISEVTALKEKAEAVPNVSYVSFKRSADVVENFSRITVHVKAALHSDDAQKTKESLQNIAKDSGLKFIIAGNIADESFFLETSTTQAVIIVSLVTLLVLFLLFLSLNNLVDPMIVVAAIGSAIAINLSTNALLPHVSFFTQLLGIGLQIALTIDYALMLINKYKAALSNGLSPSEAVIYAFKMSFLPITTSALTTAAGFAAIMFMQFKIGLDFGIALIKSIAITYALVLLLIPGLLYTFEFLRKKTTRRELRFNFLKYKGFPRPLKAAVAGVLLLAIFAAIPLQSLLNQDYSFENYSDNTKSMIALYGEESTIAILLFKSDLWEENEKNVFQEVLALKRADGTDFDGLKADSYTSSVHIALPNYAVAYDYFLAAAAEGGVNFPLARSDIRKIYEHCVSGGGNIGSFTPVSLIGYMDENMQSIKDYIDKDYIWDYTYSATVKRLKEELSANLSAAQDLFIGKNYTRILLTLPYPASSNYALELVDALQGIKSDPPLYILGDSVFITDTKDSTKSDQTFVNLMTLLFLFIVLLFAFRSLSLPLLLILLIQGALMIVFGAFALTGVPIFFLVHTITSSIVLGATTDYAVLLTTNYRENRLKYEKREAAKKAVSSSLHTVITSGIILSSVGLLTGAITSFISISQIGYFLAAGTALSVILVLLVLPQLLVLLDKPIEKTSLKRKNKTLLP